jgi:ATP-dependent protease Clp ATPase subunit
MQVLMQPRNALGRQFVYQFELSGTRLHITHDAQRAIAALVRACASSTQNLALVCIAAQTMTAGTKVHDQHAW